MASKKSHALAIADALDGWDVLTTVSTLEESDWREEPMALAEFAREMMGIELWPVQQECLEAFLGSSRADAKALFTQDGPTPYNCGVLAFGKGCLGPDECLTDEVTGLTLAVKTWAERGCPLVLQSWDGKKVTLNVTSPVYLKGVAPLYRITLEDGRSFTATNEHKCLSLEGWTRVENFEVGRTQLLTVQPQKCCDRAFQEYTKVLSVGALGDSEFYNLTVNIDHNYFDFQGILHANSGKDFASALCLAWFTHILYCLRHPQRFLGLEPTEAVDLAIASPTLRQTRRVTFTKLKNRFRRWPWLRDVLRAEYQIDFERHWKDHVQADLIELPLGPDGGVLRVNNLPLDTGAAEGFNLLAFILSEYAGLESDVKGDSATAVFETFQSSGKTRFNRAWKGFLASYPRSINDPQEKLIEAHQAGRFPELYVVRRPTWEVVPHLEYKDFEGDFIRNPEDAWAKYGAQPRSATESYFRSPDLIVKHASGGPPELFSQYFEVAPAQLKELCDRVPDPIIERDLFGDVVLNEFGFPQLARWFKGKPEREYYIHIDLGLSGDSAGFAMAHLEPVGDRADRVIPVLDVSFRWKAAHFAGRGQLQRYVWEGGTPLTTTEVEVLQSEIDLQTPVEFCVYLSRVLGFNLARVTFDQFNSATAKQTLYHYGISSQNLSVDKHPGYYDELKAVIYARQLIYRIGPVLFAELRKLVRTSNGKVDAPRSKVGEKVDSHKDEADAVAAVVGTLCNLAAASGEFYTLPEPDEILESRSDVVAPIDLAAPEEDSAKAQLWRDFFGGDSSD